MTLEVSILKKEPVWNLCEALIGESQYRPLWTLEKSDSISANLCTISQSEALVERDAYMYPGLHIIFELCLPNKL